MLSLVLSDMIASPLGVAFSYRSEHRTNERLCLIGPETGLLGEDLDLRYKLHQTDDHDVSVQYMSRSFSAGAL